MYKVIIVDDEPNIREGLKTLINWEAYGYKVVSTAKNGEEGIETYRIEQPDLLIVDIRMPKMDGLTLIDKIRKENSTVHFIILSGYADFDYARKAMQSEVEGYLLKPLDEDELIEMLESVKNKIRRAKEMQEFARFESEKIKENFIDKLISNPTAIETNEMIYFKNNFQLTDAMFSIMLLKGILNGSARAPQPNWKLKLKNKFETNQTGLVFERKDAIGILLINRNRQKENISSLYTELLKSLGNDPFIAAIGEESFELNNMSQSYLTAAKLMSQQFYFDKNTIINQKDHFFTESTSIHANLEYEENEYDKKLHYAFEIADNESCEKIIISLIDEMKEKLFSVQQIKFNAVQIFSNALNRLLRAHPNFHTALSPILEKGVEIYQLNSLPEIKEYLLTATHAILKEVDDGNTDIPVKKMLDLIHNHYSEHLRLETFAEIFNYSSAYLGRLFKNHTGEYFNTYLDHVRIEKGKELLLEGLKVYEVAELVGYANVDYFHKKFRQYVGISPSAYRKQTNS